MQASTENAKEHMKEWAGDGKSAVSRALSDVKNLKPEEIRRSAAEITSKVRDASMETYEDIAGYVRRNPAKAALSLGALGFVVGVLVGWMNRRD